MKSLIIPCAGYNTRLSSLFFPKSLLPVHQRPIIAKIIDYTNRENLSSDLYAGDLIIWNELVRSVEIKYINETQVFYRVTITTNSNDPDGYLKGRRVPAILEIIRFYSENFDEKYSKIIRLKIFEIIFSHKNYSDDEITKLIACLNKYPQSSFANFINRILINKQLFNFIKLFYKVYLLGNIALKDLVKKFYK